jgi:hypothetical protein
MEIQKKSCENCKRAEINPQILFNEIEPNPSKDRATCMHEGDNPSFLDNLSNLLFS